jgi:hypothetical protein
MDAAERLNSAVTSETQPNIDDLRGRFLFETASGNGVSQLLSRLILLRDPGFAHPIAPAPGDAGPESAFYDNRYYDRLALASVVPISLPTPARGLSSWLRNPVTAADRAAPDSGLARCR